LRLLLDTHLIVWWQTGDHRLTVSRRNLIESSEAPAMVSRVSMWELAIKNGTGRLSLDLRDFAAEVERIGFGWLPISNEHVFQLAELPTLPQHKDPFDRLLVAQAMSEPLILLTADSRLARYGDPVRVV